MKIILRFTVIILVFVLGVNRSSSAAVVYTDIAPDIVNTCPPSITFFGGVDMDNDNNPELGFIWTNLGSNWNLRGVLQVTGAELLHLPANLPNVPAFNSLNPLSLNDSIGNDTLLFTSTGLAQLSDPSGFSNFLSIGDRYIGVKFLIGANIHYGWVLVNLTSTPSPATMTIKSYAYESLPNTPILAGDTGASQVVLVNNITVNSASSSITTNGGTMQMTANVLPANATDSSVSWSVNNAIATIDTSGLLTAVSNGTVVVTATANDGSNVTGTKTITITNQIILVDSINVTSTGNTINTMGGTMQLTANVLPINATNSSVTWSLNNTNASIDNTGLLTALANGTVVVTAAANDGSNVVGSKTIFITNQTALSVTDISNNSIKLFPNPAQNYIILEGQGIESYKYKIINMKGEMVNSNNTVGNGLVRIESLSRGIYILHLFDKNGRMVNRYKLLKDK